MPSRDDWYRSEKGGWLRKDPDAPASVQATPNASPASARSPLSNAPTAAPPAAVPASSNTFNWSASSASIFASKPFSTVSPSAVEPSAPNATGSSPSGPIYSATMNDDATPVAVKIVKNVLSETDTDRFLEELHELQILPPNRNVLRHYGYVALNNGKQFGVVTQLVSEAKTLKSCLYRSCDFDGPPVIVKYRLISWLLEGLAHLHANGIVHGDLTPKSVLISREGSDFLPTLTNFGLPTLKTTSVLPHAKAGALGFNPAYASPELLRGEIGYDDVEAWKKSDVYSATVLIVEILLEQPPWEGELPVFFTKAVRKRGERPFNLDDVTVYGHKAWWLKDLLVEAWHQDASKRPAAADLKRRFSLALDYSKVCTLASRSGSTLLSAN